MYNLPVLVTGGTGFLGSRLVECLARRSQSEVRVVVRNMNRAARIARFKNVRLIAGELLDRDLVSSAASGCSTIFHCAYGNTGSEEERRAATVDGTANVVAAASSAQSRLVHVSTVAVFDTQGRQQLDEDAPYLENGDFYSATKIEAERLVLKAIAEQNLKATVLQPTSIYGPFSPFWTQFFLRAIQSGPVALPTGSGVCNLVHVDDVVLAMLKAGEREQALPGRFLVNGQSVRWTEFLGAYGAILGKDGYVEVDRKILETPRKRSRESLLRIFQALSAADPKFRERFMESREMSLLRKPIPGFVKQAVKAVVRLIARGKSKTAAPGSAAAPKSTPIYLDPVLLPMLLSSTCVSSARLRDSLDWSPTFSLADGMQSTRDWAEWMGWTPNS